MPNTEHEREICDLIARLHLQRINEILKKSWYPEDEIPPPPNAIDAAYLTDVREYVIEHTTVESYSSQITEDHKISKLLSIEDELSRRITNHGCYHIMFNTETLKDKRIGAALVEKLCSWVAQKAPALEIGGPGTAPRHMVNDVIMVEGRSIEISLYRWPGTGVRVALSRASPEKQEEKLLLQLQASLGKKIPKLIDWKRTHDAFSILILESIDPALVSGSTIAHAVCGAIQEFTEQPDRIYIIQTDRDESQVWELIPPFSFANFVEIGFFKLKKAL